MNSLARTSLFAMAACLIASPLPLGAGSANMRRDGPLTLIQTSDDNKGFYAAAIDPTNGFAYFAAKYVYKINLTTPLPTQVGPGVSLGGGQSAGGGMDVSSGCAYFASGPNIRQILANGTNPPTAGAIMFAPFGSSQFVEQIFIDETDPANHYLYALTESGGTNSTFYKIALNQYPNASAIVGSAATTAGQPALYYGTIDLSNRFAYFGPLLANGPYVVKFALGNGAAAPTNMGGCQLDTSARSTGGMALDIANGCGYVCSDGNDALYGHGRVYKFALNGNGPPSLMSFVDMQTNQGYCHVAVIKPAQQLLYFSSDLDYPAKFFRFRLNPGANPPVETGVLPLLQTTNAVVPAWGANPTNASNWGEVFTRSLVYDPVRDFAYIGRDDADAQLQPYTDQIVKVALDRDEMELSLTTPTTNGVNTMPYGESFEAYTNGATIPGAGGWFADDAMMGIVTNYDYTNDYTNGFPIFGPQALSLQVDGALTNQFAPSTDPVVLLDTIVQAREWTDPIFPTLSNTQFSLCVTTNGHLAVWNCTNPPAAGDGWTELTDTSLGSNQFARVTVEAAYNRDTNGLFAFRIWVNGAPSVNPKTWYATADATVNHFGNFVAQGHFILDDLVVAPPSITMTGITTNAAGNIQVSCKGVPSFTHRVWATGSLGPASLWQVVSTNLSNPDGSWQFTDTNNAAHPTRIYKASFP